MVSDKKRAFISIFSAFATSYLLLNILLVKPTKTISGEATQKSHTHAGLSPVSNVAGGSVIGDTSSLGDGGKALKARLNNPHGIDVDLMGNIYIADTGNSRIRKIDTHGFITSIAGNEYGTFSGDGGKATLASLNKPQDVTVGPEGSIYIADTENSRIRKLDTNGIITTIAGSGKRGFSGDGGKAALASLNKPKGVAVDQEGNVYIADTGNSRIRKVDTHGVITTSAGNGNSGFSGDGGKATLASLNRPCDIAVDAGGKLYIVDSGSERIRQVSHDGIITTAAGNGSRGPFVDGNRAEKSTINRASGVCVDTSGNFYIADTQNYRIRKVGKDGIISTMAGNINSELSMDGIVVKASIGFPYGVAASQNGSLYFIANSLVLKIDTNGIITVIAGKGEHHFWGDGGKATSASLYYPSGTDVDSGNIYIADSANQRIRKVDKNGVITTVVGSGERGFSEDATSALKTRLNYPRDIAFDSKHSIYVSDCYNNIVRKVGKNIETVAGSGKQGFSGDGGKAVHAELNRPNGIDIDNDGSLYIADTYNNRIRKVDVNRIITTAAGNGSAGFSGDGDSASHASLRYPRGVSMYNGEIFIADTDNHRIRKVDAQGIITTVAGTGTSGFSGDGGKAEKAQLNWPYSVVHAGGYMYISDSGNNCIRQVDQNGTITTIAGGEKNRKFFRETPHVLDYPKGIAADSYGNLYIAEWRKHRLKSIKINHRQKKSYQKEFF